MDRLILHNKSYNSKACQHSPAREERPPPRYATSTACRRKCCSRRLRERTPEAVDCILSFMDTAANLSKAPMKLDLHYVDPRLVELYDRANPRGADTDFYIQ